MHFTFHTFILFFLSLCYTVLFIPVHSSINAQVSTLLNFYHFFFFSQKQINCKKLVSFVTWSFDTIYSYDTLIYSSQSTASRSRVYVEEGFCKQRTLFVITMKRILLEKSIACLSSRSSLLSERSFGLRSSSYFPFFFFF